MYSQTPPWQLRTTSLAWGRMPRLMGIVNVTPDSFSDGGRFLDPGAAVDHGLRLAAEGADILDVGGESTRPYSASIPTDEELRRVVPVLQGLCEQAGVPVSIDTSKAEVAREALDAGAEIINDVTGLEGDPGMMPLAVESGAGICVMHMQGTPADMQDNPHYDDVVGEVYAYLRSRRDHLESAGIARERICLDPGVGFGKTHQHNLTLLAQVDRFRELGCPVLVGHSRKGFVARLIGSKTADRTPGTIGVSCAMARKRVEILRVHDVRAVREALLLFAASGGVDDRAWDLA